MLGLLAVRVAYTSSRGRYGVSIGAQYQMWWGLARRNKKPINAAQNTICNKKALRGLILRAKGESAYSSLRGFTVHLFVQHVKADAFIEVDITLHGNRLELLKRHAGLLTVCINGFATLAAHRLRFLLYAIL